MEKKISEETKAEVGSITWRDLTVPDAGSVQAFYTQVVGWKPSPHAMGDYDDFNVQTPGTDEVVAATPTFLRNGSSTSRSPTTSTPAPRRASSWVVSLSMGPATWAAGASVSSETPPVRWPD
jgi:hypothetical protein